MVFQRLKILYVLVLHAEIVTISSSKMVTIVTIIKIFLFILWIEGHLNIVFLVLPLRQSYCQGKYVLIFNFSSI